MIAIDQKLVDGYAADFAAEPELLVRYEIRWASAALAKAYASAMNKQRNGIVFTSERNKLVFECRNKRMPAALLPTFAAYAGYRGKIAVIQKEG